MSEATAPDQPPTNYDLVIIGMGTGGLAAAEFAAGLGLRVAAVEHSRLGGDQLWTGCVPSKALLASARVAHTMRTAHRLGIDSAEPRIDLATVWQRVRAVQAGIAADEDDPQRYRDMGVDLFSGTACLTGANEVSVSYDNDRRVTLHARFVLACTGSHPHIPPIDGLASAGCLTSESLFRLAAPPASMVIIGGGPMGVEMAQALQHLGVRSTVLQRSRTLLPREEPSLASRLTHLLTEDGIAVLTSADVRSVRRGADGTMSVAAIVGDDGRRLQLDAGGVLVACGRRPSTEGLGLESLGVVVTELGVQVDERGRTALHTVYAAGDVTSRSVLANSARHGALTAVRDMFFPGRANHAVVVPSCVFTDPELASVGLTVEAAEQIHGADTEAWRLDLAHNDRARTDACEEGAMVVVTVKGRIVGAHVLAPGAGEMIHELSLAIQRDLRLDDLAEVVHVYPTLSAAFGQLATESTYEKAQRMRWLMKRR